MLNQPTQPPSLDHNQPEIDKSVKRTGLLERWYLLTAPPPPAINASFAQREQYRRGRLASIILLFLIFFGLLATPNFVLGNMGFYALIGHLASLTIYIVALFLNRKGWVTIAGILVVISITLSFVLLLIGPIGLSSVPLFALFILPELIAVSLLPTRWVFVSALVNSLFVWGNLTFLPHMSDLVSLLKISRYSVMLEPISLYILVAVVTFLWVHSATQAFQRADRAEEIAALELREVERQQQEIEQRRELDKGIGLILQVHVEAANGNFTARAPLAQDNVLWQIAYSLNNLLARLQGYSQLEVENRQIRMQLAQLLEDIYDAKKNSRPIRSGRGGTILDSLLQVLNGHVLGQPGQPSSPLQNPYGSIDGRQPLPNQDSQKSGIPLRPRPGEPGRASNPNIRRSDFNQEKF